MTSSRLHLPGATRLERGIPIEFLPAEHMKRCLGQMPGHRPDGLAVPFASPQPQVENHLRCPDRHVSRALVCCTTCRTRPVMVASVSVRAWTARREIPHFFDHRLGLVQNLPRHAQKLGILLPPSLLGWLTRLATVGSSPVA